MWLAENFITVLIHEREQIYYIKHSGLNFLFSIKYTHFCTDTAAVIWYLCGKTQQKAKQEATHKHTHTHTTGFFPSFLIKKLLERQVALVWHFYQKQKC